MRPGLVAVGVAFVLVGASIIITVLLPNNATSVERTSTAVVDQLAPGDYHWFDFSATGKASGSLSLSWVASGKVAVTWYQLSSCSGSTGSCFNSTALHQWFSTTSGTWSTSGSVASLYRLWVQDNANQSINFSASLSEVYHPLPLALQLIPLALVLSGGSLLIGTGAVAVYLGLFLPSGTFEGFGAPPPVPDDLGTPAEGDGTDPPPPSRRAGSR